MQENILSFEKKRKEKKSIVNSMVKSVIAFGFFLFKTKRCQIGMLYVHYLVYMITTAGDRIPITEMDENVVAMYVQEVKLKFEEVFIPFKKLFRTRKVGFGFCCNKKRVLFKLVLQIILILYQIPILFFF